jgi:hypothetical protein
MRRSGQRGKQAVVIVRTFSTATALLAALREVQKIEDATFRMTTTTRSSIKDDHRLDGRFSVLVSSCVFVLLAGNWFAIATRKKTGEKLFPSPPCSNILRY